MRSSSSTSDRTNYTLDIASRHPNDEESILPADKVLFDLFSLIHIVLASLVARNRIMPNQQPDFNA